MRVNVKLKNGEYAEAVLVDVLPRLQHAPYSLVTRYYGSNPPLHAYYPLEKARFVFHLLSGGYYVIGDTMAGREFWRFHGTVVSRER